MRLIDADELCVNLEELYCKGCNSYDGVKCRACNISDAIGYIDDAPTVELRNEQKIDWFMCPKCNYMSTPFRDSCHCCGADMRNAKRLHETYEV